MVLRPIAVGAEAEHQEILEELRAWKVGALQAALIDERELALPAEALGGGVGGDSPPRAAAEGVRNVLVVDTGEELHEWAAGNGFGFAPPLPRAGAGAGVAAAAAGGGPLPGVQLKGIAALGKAPLPPMRAVPAPPSALPPTARRRGGCARMGFLAPPLDPCMPSIAADRVLSGRAQAHPLDEQPAERRIIIGVRKRRRWQQPLVDRIGRSEVGRGVPSSWRSRCWRQSWPTRHAINLRSRGSGGPP